MELIACTRSAIADATCEHVIRPLMSGVPTPPAGTPSGVSSWGSLFLSGVRSVPVESALPRSVPPPFN